MLLVIRAFNIERFQSWSIFFTIHKRVTGIPIKINNKEKRKMIFPVQSDCFHKLELVFVNGIADWAKRLFATFVPPTAHRQK